MTEETRRAIEFIEGRISFHKTSIEFIDKNEKMRQFMKIHLIEREAHEIENFEMLKKVIEDLEKQLKDKTGEEKHETHA